MSDSRKSTITAKVAAEIVEYYKLALKNAAIVYDQGILGSSLYKVSIKISKQQKTFYFFYRSVFFLTLDFFIIEIERDKVCQLFSKVLTIFVTTCVCVYERMLLIFSFILFCIEMLSRVDFIFLMSSLN